MTTWIIIEDEPDIYDTLMTVIEHRGLQPIGITNVNDAIALIEDIDSNRFHGELPAVALIDIRLPNHDQLDLFGGVEIGERIRQSSRLTGIKVVLMTAYRLSPNEENACIDRAGADLLLYKPFSMSILSEFNSL